MSGNPAPPATCIPSAKRTGSRTWRRQYAALARLPRQPSSARLHSMPRRSSAADSRCCSRSAQTHPASAPCAPSGRHAIPPAAGRRYPLPPDCASAASTACSSPEITVLRGPLKAAIEIRVSPLGDSLAHLLRTGQNRRHRPARRQRLHQAPARRDQLQPIFQAEHSRHARGHIFAHAVSQHRRRLDPPGFPELAKRVLQREQRRLRIGGLMQQRARRLVREHNLQQRLIQMRRQQFRAMVQRRRNVGCVSYNCRPIPTYCEPCPVNRKANSGAAAPSNSPRATVAVSPPVARLSSLADSSSADFAVSAARSFM